MSGKQFGSSADWRDNASKSVLAELFEFPKSNQVQRL